MKFVIVIRISGTPDGNTRDVEIPLSVNFERDDVNRMVSVQWLKSVVRGEIPFCTNRRLRLIFNGRVLNEKTNFGTELFGSYYHSPQTSNDDSDPPERIFIHCAVGDELSAQQLAEETKWDNTPQQRSTAPAEIGFDRLLNQGFSREDVADLRRQFAMVHLRDHAATSARTTEGIADLEEEETRLRNLRLMEERWIESTVMPSEGPGRGPRPVLTLDPVVAEENTPQIDDDSGQESNTDILIGLLVGVFLGAVALVFMAADSTVFSRSQGMAVIAGVFLNFSFAITRGQWV